MYNFCKNFKGGVSLFVSSYIYTYMQLNMDYYLGELGVMGESRRVTLIIRLNFILLTFPAFIALPVIQTR